MRDKLLVQLITAVSDENKATKSLTSLKERFSVILNQYDVQERCTALVPYEVFP